MHAARRVVGLAAYFRPIPANPSEARSGQATILLRMPLGIR
jgi:hypothetical protein